MRAETKTVTIVVFSANASVRESIVTSADGGAAPYPKRVTYADTDDPDVVFEALTSGAAQIAILDGAAKLFGGIGLARQLKDELEPPPPIIVAVRRELDRWLARWCGADEVVVFPLDPAALGDAVARVLRLQASAS